MTAEQLGFAAIWPKTGSVKAAVLKLLKDHPGGMCRRTFARSDIYEVANRIAELERDGWKIGRDRCTIHNHRQRFTLYYLET